MIKKGESIGQLAGLCVAVKSCISVKGLETNCASKTLEGYVSPYNASVINNLLSEGAIVLGMVNMDEFACGASGENSAFGPTKHPKNKDLIPGGSSSGSAAAVAADLCDFALGSDTGGSIRNPASHCGIVGLKPTYGAVSRYGLIDMCMSLDCIGPLTKTVEDSELVFEVIKGQDNFDTTTSNKVSKEEVKIKKVVGVVDIKDFATKEIGEKYNEIVKEFAKKNNYEIKNVKLPLDIAIETYYILVYTEFFSGTRKFDGKRFGKKIDEVGGAEVQRRIVGGSEITKAEFEDRFYNKALNAKQFISGSFEKLFKDVDVILLPTVPKLAHKIGEKLTLEENYAYDVFTCLINIAGVCAISVPVGQIDGKEIGMQVIGNIFNEKELFKIGVMLE
jgi:aspartyl-tRNA(Asn)/glutamyl-tRNA(Gln) amidotransferase subunit A